MITNDYLIGTYSMYRKLIREQFPVCPPREYGISLQRKRKKKKK